MLIKFRRKIANAINPDITQVEASHSYPARDVRWQSDEDFNRVALASNHKAFEMDHGRKAINDDEAVTYIKGITKVLRERALKNRSNENRT